MTLKNGMVSLLVRDAVGGGNIMTNIVHLDNFRTILDVRTVNIGCGSCNTIACICADLELRELIAHDWLKDLDCDGLCNNCWFKHGCIGTDDAIPIHLLQEKVILLKEVIS